jgi:hypothetical protein
MATCVRHVYALHGGAGRAKKDANVKCRRLVASNTPIRQLGGTRQNSRNTEDKSMSKKETLCGEVYVACEKAGIHVPVTEYRFDDLRRWRFDMAWPYVRVAVEIQGGVFNGGKHGRGEGIVKDHEKLNHAQLAGWIVLQVRPKTLASVVVELVEKAIDLRQQQWIEWCPDCRVSIPIADLPVLRISSPESGEPPFHASIDPFERVRAILRKNRPSEKPCYIM